MINSHLLVLLLMELSVMAPMAQVVSQLNTPLVLNLVPLV